MKTQETTIKRENKHESKPVVLNRNNLKCHVSTTAHGFGTFWTFVINLKTHASCLLTSDQLRKKSL